MPPPICGQAVSKQKFLVLFNTKLLDLDTQEVGKGVMDAGIGWFPPECLPERC